MPSIDLVNICGQNLDRFRPLQQSYAVSSWYL